MVSITAQADASAAITIFQVVFSAAISLALWRMTAWQRRYEGAEQRLHEATGRVIDERIRALTLQLDGASHANAVARDELRQRLAATDTAIAAMADRDLKIEQALASRLDLLKDYIRDSSPSKTDLDRYEAVVDRRLTRIEARLEELAA